jgi:tetracycline resistance efflux pump
VPLLLLLGGSFAGVAAGLDCTWVFPLAAGASWVAAVLWSLPAAMPAVRDGVRRMWVPVAAVTAVLAFARITGDLGTGPWLAAAVQAAAIGPMLPLALFLLAGAVAFATGSRLLAIATLVPSVAAMAPALADDGRAAPVLWLCCLAAGLEGACAGAHASPASATTRDSAAGAQCEVALHVAAQRPATWLVFATSALLCYLPLGWLGPESRLWCLGAGVVVLALGLAIWGRQPSR